MIVCEKLSWVVMADVFSDMQEHALEQYHECLRQEAEYNEMVKEMNRRV
jgi:hypothetical protein